MFLQIVNIGCYCSFCCLLRNHCSFVDSLTKAFMLTGKGLDALFGLVYLGTESLVC